MIEKLKRLFASCLARAWMCHLLKQLRNHQLHFAAGLTCSQLTDGVRAEIQSGHEERCNSPTLRTNPIMSIYIRFKTWTFNFLMNWWVNSMAPRLSRRVEMAILEGDAEASSIDKIKQEKYS